MRSRSAAHASAESHRKACCTSGTSGPPHLIVRLASPLTAFSFPLSPVIDRRVPACAEGSTLSGQQRPDRETQEIQPEPTPRRRVHLLARDHRGSPGQHPVRPPPYGNLDARGGVKNVALDSVTVQRLRRGTATSLGIYVICAVGLRVVATLAAPVRAEEPETRA
jgi:hypothetical protein